MSQTQGPWEKCAAPQQVMQPVRGINVFKLNVCWLKTSTDCNTKSLIMHVDYFTWERTASDQYV